MCKPKLTNNSTHVYSIVSEAVQQRRARYLQNQATVTTVHLLIETRLAPTRLARRNSDVDSLTGSGFINNVSTTGNYGRFARPLWPHIATSRRQWQDRHSPTDMCTQLHKVRPLRYMVCHYFWATTSSQIRCSDVTKFSIYGHQVHAAML